MSRYLSRYLSGEWRVLLTIGIGNPYDESVLLSTSSRAGFKDLTTLLVIKVLYKRLAVLNVLRKERLRRV